MHNQGKGISKRQKLGETEYAHDEAYLQFMLYGMELGEALIRGAVAEEDDD